MLHRIRPDDDEVTGLLALMLLTDARRPARTDEHGDLVPMAEQDRSRWNAGYIREGIDLLTAAVAHHNPGPYQIQAAIAALHDEAGTAAETDWVQIRALYERLRQVSDNPVVALNHAVAVAMADGPGRRSRLPRRTSPPIPGSANIHGSTPFCSSARDGRRRRDAARVSPIWTRPGAAPASRSSATCTPAPHGWRETRRHPATATGNLGAVSSDRTRTRNRLRAGRVRAVGCRSTVLAPGQERPARWSCWPTGSSGR